jgi:hypothetical protein
VGSAGTAGLLDSPLGGAGSAGTAGMGSEDASGGSDGGVGEAVKTGLAAPAQAVKDLFESSPGSSGGSSNSPAAAVTQPSDGVGVLSLLAFVAGLGLLGYAIKREVTA